MALFLLRLYFTRRFRTVDFLRLLKKNLRKMKIISILSELRNRSSRKNFENVKISQRRIFFRSPFRFDKENVRFYSFEWIETRPKIIFMKIVFIDQLIDGFWIQSAQSSLEKQISSDGINDFEREKINRFVKLEKQKIVLFRVDNLEDCRSIEEKYEILRLISALYDRMLPFNLLQ